MYYICVVVVNVKVLISSYEFTAWLVLLVGLSIIAYYLCFMLLSFLFESSTLYGCMQITFEIVLNYLVLVFFTFCYIIIDTGLMMANSELRNFLQEKRAQFKRAEARRHKEDKTLHKGILSNF